MQNCMGAMSAWRIDEQPAVRQDLAMSRRNFLQVLPTLGASSLLSGPLLGACSPASPAAAASVPPGPSPRRKIRGICFDLFTLFDPRSVVTVATSIVGEQGPSLCDAWRLRQFEYCWLRVAAKRYVDFRVVTDEALRFAAKSKQLTLSEEARRAMVDAYSQLTPWPDAHAALVAWKQQGLRLAPLANYAPAMLGGLLAHAGFTDLFTTQISTDIAQTFKPDPAAYALGESRLGLAREELAFAAFGGWDAAGAKWFGFPTFWVNRLGVTPEQLIEPDATGSTLAELSEFVARW